MKPVPPYRRRIVPVVLATALMLTAAARFFGPPSIRVQEVSGTPPTAGAVLVVTTTHHTDEATPKITATAEGMRAGQRVQQPVEVTKSATAGRYGVTKQWEAGTPWVLVFSVEQADHGDFGPVSALVKVDATGKVIGAESLMQTNARGDRFGRKATEADIAAALKSLQ